MMMSKVSVEPHQEMMGTGESVGFFSRGQSPRLTTNSMSGSLTCSGGIGFGKVRGEGEGWQGESGRGDGWEGEV